MPRPSINSNENGFYVHCEGVGLSNQTQYLQTDGTWGHYPVAVGDSSKLTGYFPSKEEAERVLALAGTPTKVLPSVTLTCRKCDHIYYRHEEHECPTPEYINFRDRLIREACIADEQWRAEGGFER